jgi:DNA modification methylase
MEAKGDVTDNSIHKAYGRLQVTYLPISSLKLEPRNPRVHTRKQVQQIARSIQAFDFNIPVVVDADLRLIAGHGRVLACQLLGWRDIPTIRLDHLNPAQAKAFAIADNRLSETSVWNDRLLAEQLQELSVLDLEFDLEAIGFDMGEIDLRIEGLGDEESEVVTSNEPPSAPSGPAVSSLGDLWVLGRHRLLCSNALDAASYEILLEAKPANLIFVDPPYNVPIQGHATGLGAVHHREFLMASGEMSSSEFTTFLTNVCSLLALNSVDGSIHFVCMDWRHMMELLTAGRQAYSELKNVCVWVKENGGMGSLYRSQHELVFVYKHGRERHRNNVQLGSYGRNRSNVWKYPGMNSFPRADGERDLFAAHPTLKPARLVEDAILDCSGRNDIVLDCFLGGGTTLIAAERTGRRCCGMELDPLYVDVAIRRWQKLTNLAARHSVTGQLFDALEVETEAVHGR